MPITKGFQALVNEAMSFAQNLTRTQALTLVDPDSAVGVGLMSCLKRPTS